MNWRKGLLRLWCALSLCWIVGVGISAWKQEQGRAARKEAWDRCIEQKEIAGENSFEQRSVCISSSGFSSIEQYVDETFIYPDTVTWAIKKYSREYAALALLPPLFALALGLLGAWVVSGFRGVKKLADLEASKNKRRAGSGNAD
jgi:hypothetical protein